MKKRLKLLFDKLKFFFIKIKLKRGIKLLPIKNGIVVDHISGGQAQNILKVLGIKPGTKEMVDIVINVKSQKLGKKDKPGKKDVVKIEGKALNSMELDEIALIAPMATISKISDYIVEEKDKVKLPEETEGILRCPDPNCVSNNQPVLSKFILKKRKPMVYECFYCERKIEGEKIMKSIKEQKGSS